jgi:hypothetical protein
MPKIQFIGRVLPAVAMVTVQTPDLQWKWEAEGLDPAFKVKIGNSVINVECDIAKYEPQYFIELYKRASDLARAAVNVVAFASGLGLSVILETLIGPDGMPSAILPQDPATPPLCTAYGLDPSRLADLDAVYRLVVAEPPLFRALSDLIEAITVVHVSCVNCGRAIDSIRRMITPPGTTSEKQAWIAMQAALNISPAYQRFISDNATGPRHGDPSFVPGNITTEVTHRAWAVMNRYLEYRKRGNAPLIAPEFPLLS